jgi:dipeptidyl aminopeptidase/acylaminoacyl peptidase
MSDLKALLEHADRAVSDVPLPADGLEWLQRRRDRKRRNKRITAGAVGIAVFVAAVWVVTTGGSFNHTQQPAIQPTPTPPAGIIAPETIGYLIDLKTAEVTQLPKSIVGVGYAVSPDGTMVAYTSQDDAGNPQVFIASLDGTDVQQVTHDQRGAWSPDWSPDGAAVAYARWQASSEGDVSNIFVLDLATGETSQVTNEKPTTESCYGPAVGQLCAPLGAGYPQFSPDGASVVYQVHRVGENDVRIVPVTGGKSILLVGGKHDAILGTLSPDGSTLAASCWGPELIAGICIAHTDGTNLRVLVSGSLVGGRWSPDGTRIAYTNANATTNRVFVVDVATGETTFVAEGFASDWLDDHTLIIERLA